MKKTLQKRLAFLAFLLGVGGSALAQGSVQDSSLATKTNSTEDIGCVDGNGTPIPSQLIWQEDFGTFTSDSTYWTWDYSDLNAPKKVTHTDGNKWSTCYGLSIPGAECDKSPSVEGKYTVAGNVTCQYDGVTGGTQWGWEAICFNGKYPRENSYTFVPDHTYQGSDFGGMLFLNCGNEPNEVIYSKRITSSILKDQNVTARCFVNTFSDAINPVEIYIQLTDMKTGNVTKSTTVIRDSKTDGLEWKQANVRSFIEGDSILIEVVSVGGGNEYNKNGNDLILDDIQLLICGEETKLFECTQSKEPVIYANDKNEKSIHIKPGESVTLTSNNVTSTDILGEPYTNFTTSWHKGNAESSPIGKKVGVFANPLEVKWKDANKNGTTFILKVQDNIVDLSSGVTNSTSFETIDSLCNLNLSNDENGWFSEGVAEVIAACGQSQEFVNKLHQKGIIAKVSSPSKLFDSKSWERCLKSQDGTDAGMTAIVRNPKLIDPILWEGNGTNMLVNAGTTHNTPTAFLTYTLQGLQPGSQVTLSADFYYLLDEESLNTYYRLNGLGINDQLYNGLLRADNSGKVKEMPDAVIRWTTQLDSYGDPDFLRTSKAISLKKETGAQAMTLTGVADARGQITFYFGRNNPDNTPIGIDNIKVTATVSKGILDMDDNGSGICKTYDTIVVYADTIPASELYCETADGKQIPQKLVWQEDFGTFTSDSTYWTWDYSDLNAPKKVTHSDGKEWTSCFGLSIPGAECDKSPSIEGKYTVAGNVTCEYDGVIGGTQWGWEAMCFNGKYPRENGYAFVPDHTYQGSDFGGMLFINGGNETTSVIYAKQISSPELKGKNVTARCFVNTFSDAINPVEVYIRLTDPSKGNYVDNNVKKDPTTDGVAWKEANASITLSGDSVLIEIINVVGGPDYNKAGNDLVLDDIQLYICEGETDIPVCTQPKVPVIYANGKDVKSIHLKSGESVTLTSNDVTATDKDGNPYTNYTMSWHKGNEGSAPIKKTTGVVADSLVVSWGDATTNGTTFILKVQDNVLDANGKRINDCNTYDTITVYADADTTPEIESYCLDGNGNKIPQILLWQEDFGTFTSDSTYWTWDYSDLNEPKKVTHTDGNKWTSCFGLSIPGAECDKSPSVEGKYTVAGNVTCQYDGVAGGTQWGWEAICFNGKYPRENGYTFVPDHTYEGSDFGGMLFLNCGNEPNEVIYAKKISNPKLKGNNITAKCFVNTFSDAPNPVEVFIRLTDLSSGNSETSGVVTKDTRREGLVWHEAYVSAFMEGDSVLIEIISAAGGDDYNKAGNDLVLDDIQLYMCDDSEHVGVETQPAADMDELVNVYTISGIIVKTNVKRSEALDGLKKGTYYIVGHEKVLIDL